MPIERSHFKRNIMVICDFPLVEEEKNGKAFSESSHTNLKDALNASAVNEGRVRGTINHMSSLEVCYTYLSVHRPDAKDSDWATSVVNKKSMAQGKEYTQIPWLKDTYVTKNVLIELLAIIEQIKSVQPRLVVLAGKWSLFFLSAQITSDKQVCTISDTKNAPKKTKWFGGLYKWRASLMRFNPLLELPEAVVMPILSPAYHWIIKDKVKIIQNDYMRIAMLNSALQTVPVERLLYTRRNNIVAENKDHVIQYLKTLYDTLEREPTLVVFDVETMFKGIDCEGICYKETESFTIPFFRAVEGVFDAERDAGTIMWSVTKKEEKIVNIKHGQQIWKFENCWTLEEETEILFWLRKVKAHPNCLHVGQNYLYDCQWYFSEWKLKINATHDTMILHHVLFNYMQKDLGLLASLYCFDYVAWKDELNSKNMERWQYNGKDCCYTYTICKQLLQRLQREKQSLQDFYRFQQQDVCSVVVTMMNRGVAVNNSFKEDMRLQFTDIYAGCIEKLNWVFMEEINLNSTPQVKRAFKDMLGIVPIKNRKTKSESFNAEAMLVYLDRYPEYRPLLTLFLESKSIKVFLRTFLNMQLSDDGRLRCSYNPAGTKTYRFSSRKNINGTGGNLANIPSHGKIDLRYAIQELLTDESQESEEDESSMEEILSDVVAERTGNIELPNCKKMFIPDFGKIIADADYSAIDLHFVVWESDCKFLKEIMKAGKDVYSVLASHYYGREIGKFLNPLTGVWEWMPERQIFKSICHGANYLGKAPTLSAKSGLSIGRVKQVLDWYFSMCPEIPAWHERIKRDILAQRYTENVFGARFWCMNPNDRDDPMWLNKMVAAVPQSSAAILVNKAIVALEANEKGKIQTLLQVHDSIVCQFDKDDTTALERIKKYMEIVIPYENDPLVIPAGIKVSPYSYGDCTDRKRFNENWEPV